MKYDETCVFLFFIENLSKHESVILSPDMDECHRLVVTGRY